MADTKNVEITAVEFGRYLALQGSGLTNMFDVKVVMYHTGLPRYKVLYIMEHYSELCEKYDK